MAKRKSTTANEPSAQPATDTTPEETASRGEEPAPAVPAEPKTYAPIPAPPPGGRSWTTDNALGYRVEDIDTPEGKRRQIRFADREGGQRPDDETLEPVRKRKPIVKYRSQDKGWQARQNAEGFQALAEADQELAEIGRKRTGGPQR